MAGHEMMASDHLIIRVLLIDDSASDRRLIRELLAKSRDVSFDVAFAETLAAGLELAAAGSPDVLVIDLGLPDSKGLGTFTRAHRAAPHLPIVILAAKTNAQKKSRRSGPLVGLTGTRSSSTNCSSWDR